MVKRSVSGAGYLSFFNAAEGNGSGGEYLFFFDAAKGSDSGGGYLSFGEILGEEDDKAIVNKLI